MPLLYVGDQDTGISVWALLGVDHTWCAYVPRFEAIASRRDPGPGPVLGPYVRLGMNLLLLVRQSFKVFVSKS